MERLKWIAIALLSGMLLLQVQGGFFFGAGSPAPRILFSETTLEEAGLDTIVQPDPGSCIALYFVNSSCDACDVLAENWTTDSTVLEPSLWIIEGSPQSRRQFVARHRLGDQRVRFLGSDGGFPGSLVGLGIHATPTSAIVDHRGLIQHVRVSSIPITREQGAAFCRS